MARKPAAVELRERDLIAWYKWEFLRRNAEYCKDYANFMQEFSPWFLAHGAWYDRTTMYDAKALRFFEETIAPKAKQICERWQIADPCPPEWQFKELGFHPNHSFTVTVPTDCSKEDAGEGWDIPKASIVNRKAGERVAKPAKSKQDPRSDHDCVLQLDLRRPSIQLLRQARNQIRKRKTAYDSLHPTPTPPVRRRLGLYDVYLRVWDLRAQNMTFAAIGELVFPGQAGVAKHARDSFRRAKEFIEGGYQQLR
jgi:hypothetical protein